MENFKISSKTKRELKNAKEEFNKYDNNQLLNNADYQKAFNNLYRLCRLAEAEIAESKAIKKFDFLKDENPIEKGDVTSKVEADLRSEGITENSCKPSNNGSGTGSGSGTGTGAGTETGSSSSTGGGAGDGDIAEEDPTGEEEDTSDWW